MTRQRFLAKQQCVENVIVVDALDVCELSVNIFITVSPWWFASVSISGVESLFQHAHHRLNCQALFSIRIYPACSFARLACIMPNTHDQVGDYRIICLFGLRTFSHITFVRLLPVRRIDH